jgi:uncharacterized Zn-finger protein
MSSEHPERTAPANAEKRYTVHRNELPVSCPLPGTSLWSSHPRVYLPLEEAGRARCPYCGAEYVLVD